MENARAIAAHELRTTKLYERTKRIPRMKIPSGVAAAAPALPGS